MGKIIQPGVQYRGRISEFGGPTDRGVALDEGLALYNESMAAARPDLFLSTEEACANASKIEEKKIVKLGLARRLDPDALYCAMRWNYRATPQHVLRRSQVKIWMPDAPGKYVLASPVDWGPNERLNRLIDVSPRAMMSLAAKTDNVVAVTLLLPFERP